MTGHGHRVLCPWCGKMVLVNDGANFSGHIRYCKKAPAIVKAAYKEPYPA